MEKWNREWDMIGNRSVREDFTEKVKVGVMSVLEGRAFPQRK